MKNRLAGLALALPFVALNAGSTVPPEARAAPASAPSTASGSAPPTWLLAQDRRMPACKLDNRDVPVGTTICQQKRVWVCERGQWVNSGKLC